ncbi:hypothetical protein CGW93_03585 [candidate division bacterium WOR-3 4484_18]|uniref:Uncharacterized protein n=1 Tax=candidate division WOR-3 bacterium 4484_18 TaxID=2020626 RepID=A0A257LTC8_UNCW3|nr:MAG: hypothetical protein CGW93_03585 [candidate division bacterium WOR-3 4484_18]
MTGYDSKLKKPGKDLNFTLRNTIRFGQGNIHQAKAQTKMSDNSYRRRLLALHITADKKLRYASPKLPSATSFIRNTLSAIANIKD